MRKSFANAFTIVEISIVLVIIGILAGGTIIGQDIITNSRINAVITDINKIKQAVVTFNNKYGALPGDIADNNTGVTSGGVGNGNGIIDNNEDVLFWRHLSNANLYPGNFSGLAADRYTTTSGTNIGGVPLGAIPGSGYRVISDSNGLVISVDGYNSTNNDRGVFTPSQAFNLDQKYDDGFATSGLIKGYDGSNVVANSCVLANGKYNLSNTDNSCRLTFTVDKINVTAANASTCAGGYALGSSRESATQACNVGQIGKIIEECIQTTTGPQWQVTRNDCQPVKCAFGVIAGSTINWPCPYGWSGNVVLTCQNSGMFSIDSTGCTINTVTSLCLKEDKGSGSPMAPVRNLACPIGQTGYVVQSCNGTNWTTVINQCSAQATCAGGIALGNSEAIGSLGCNNANYTLAAGTNIQQACRLNTLVGATFDIPQHSQCLPIYTGAPCIAGSTRDIGCPTGYSGTHIQSCVSSGIYITKENNCKLVTCNNEPVGSFRISKGASCNSNEVGVVLEVCTNNAGVGEWVRHYNCTPRRCETVTSGDQNSGLGIFTTATGYMSHANHNATLCPGVGIYTTLTNNIPAAYSRRCGFDGTWQGRDGSCLAAGCPELITQNTTSATDSTQMYYQIWPAYSTSIGQYSPEHGEYAISVLTTPGTSGTPRCDQTGVVAPYVRTVTRNIKLICNARGSWVDFCSTQAQLNTALPQTSINVNTRIKAVNAMDSQFDAGNNDLLQDTTNGVYIKYCADADNNNLCNEGSASSAERCSTCDISGEYVCFY